MPLQARVTLEMVPFDGRAVGAAPEGCDRCLGCRCEHILNAQRVFGSSSWPKSVGSTSTVVCVMLVGPLGARVSLKMVHLMGGPSVARPELFAVPLRAYYDCKRVPGRFFGRGRITCAEFFCGGAVHGQAASGSCFDRDGTF